MIIFRDVSISPYSLDVINKKSREFFFANLNNISYAARLVGDHISCLVTSFEDMDKSYNFQTKLKEINKERLLKYSSAIILKIVMGSMDVNPIKIEKWELPRY